MPKTDKSTIPQEKDPESEGAYRWLLSPRRTASFGSRRPAALCPAAANADGDERIPLQMLEYASDATSEQLRETSTPHPVDATLPIALKLILLSVFLPPESSFFIAGLRLTVTRFIFLSLMPILFMRGVQRVAAGQYRFVLADLFVPLAAIWMFVGPSVSFGFADTLVHSGPDALEYLGGYMATRLLLTRPGQALAFVTLMCCVIAAVALDGLLDTLTGQFFTRALVSNLTGFHQTGGGGADDLYRLGLIRATGPIEHPILFGFVCANGLLCAIAVEIRFRKLCVAACGLGVVISLSSAPWLCVIIGLGLLTYNRLAAGLASRWLILWIGFGIFFTILLLGSNRPFGVLVETLTIDPATAYYRLFQWNMIGPLVLERPYFSIIVPEDVYQGSVDSLWLVLAMVYGMPCSVFTGLAMIGSCSLPTRPPGALLSMSEAKLGTTLGILIFIIIFMGFTVDLWGSAWIFAGLLIGLRAHLGELGQVNKAEVS